MKGWEAWGEGGVDLLPLVVHLEKNSTCFFSPSGKRLYYVHLTPELIKLQINKRFSLQVERDCTLYPRTDTFSLYSIKIRTTTRLIVGSVVHVCVCVWGGGREGGWGGVGLHVFGGGEILCMKTKALQKLGLEALASSRPLIFVL